MRRIWIPLLIVVLTVWPLSQSESEGQTPDRGVEIIRLSCVQRCLHSDDPPFQEKEYTESDDIHAFKRAISNARAMEGMLNYGAEFELVILYNGQPTEQYHLSLNREKGREGLLVRLPNTHQGYVIPISDADRLRDLIWD